MEWTWKSIIYLILFCKWEKKKWKPLLHGPLFLVLGFWDFNCKFIWLFDRLALKPFDILSLCTQALSTVVFFY